MRALVLKKSIGATDAWFRDMYYNNEIVGLYNRNKTYGFSVRCVLRE